MKDYAKGGQIIAYKKDAPKFKKIDVTDKYVIEAINEIGLQDVKFDKSSINEKIKSEFEKLLDNTSEYIISEDSNAITNAIEYDIQARYRMGDTENNINSYKKILDSPSQRKSQYIDKYAETQKETINEWTSYLKQSEYPVAIKFLILKSVLNFNYDYKLNELLKRNNKTIRNFTPFDAGSLSELVNSDSDNLLKDYTQIQVENSAKIMQDKEIIKTSGNGTWLKFNGGSKTSQEERLKNSKELAQLVQNTYWCTKTLAKNQLDGGNFYVYVTETNGEVFPRIAIRMEGDKVWEVRGNKSSAQDIEEEMLPVAEKFLTENITNGSGKKWLDGIRYNQEATYLYDKISKKGLFKNSIEEFIELKSKEKQNLLDYAQRNGHIVRLEKLIEEKIENLPNEFYGEKEVASNIYGYDYEKTKIILDYANFENSEYTDLGKLTTIGGDANFKFSKITDLGNLKYIGGDAKFGKVTDLGQLTTIGGNAELDFIQVTDLIKLTTIGGNATFRNSEIIDLGSLQNIGGDANFYESKINDLGNLEYIGGNANFYESKITNLGSLNTIGYNAEFEDSQVTDLGNLEYIGQDAHFEDSKVTNLGKLKSIGRDAYFNRSSVINLGKLESIGRNARFDGTEILDLGKLTTIGGDANFHYSLITNLGNLKFIGGHIAFAITEIVNLGKLTTIGRGADFRNSKITDLGNLTTVDNADFRSSEITDLGKLTTINKKADFRNSKITDLGQLTTINGLADFNNSQINDLGNLKYIETPHFGYSIDLERKWEKRQKSNNFSIGGEVSNTNIIAQVWDWFGIKF